MFVAEITRSRPTCASKLMKTTGASGEVWSGMADVHSPRTYTQPGAADALRVGLH
jgi:hypothetical protein